MNTETSIENAAKKAAENLVNKIDIKPEIIEPNLNTIIESKIEEKEEDIIAKEELEKQNQVKVEAELEEKNKASIEAKEELDKNIKEKPVIDKIVDDLEELTEEDKAHLVYLNETPEEDKIKGNRKEKIIDEESIKPYKEKAIAYDEIEKDPLIKAIIDYRKSGGNDINEFVSQLGITDVNKMTPEQLYETDLKKLNLTSEQFEEEMDAFRSLRPAQQQRETLDIKNKIIQERDEKLKTYSVNVNKSAQEEEAVLNKAISIGIKELDIDMAKTVNQKYKGLFVTPEMADEVKTYVSQHTVPILENGKFVGFDIKESKRMAFLALYEKEMLKANYQLGKTSGTEKALKVRLRPNKVESVSTVVPIIKREVKEEAKSAGEKLWAQRGYK